MQQEEVKKKKLERTVAKAYREPNVRIKIFTKMANFKDDHAHDDVSSL